MEVALGLVGETEVYYGFYVGDVKATGNKVCG
jgi:hypothetical protein